jgi:hypothetical protein
MAVLATKPFLVFIRQGMSTKFVLVMSLLIQYYTVIFIRD